MKLTDDPDGLWMAAAILFAVIVALGAVLELITGVHFAIKFW